MESTASKRKSRKAKIKSRMRKIVPKKFRGGKGDHDSAIAEDEGEGAIDIAEEESDNGSVASSVSDNVEDDDGDSSVCSDHRLSDVIEEADGDEGCKIEPAAARRYMVVCLIVLAGLVGGRSVALVLTLLCLLVLKLGQAFFR